MKALQSALAREVLKAGINPLRPFVWRGVSYEPVKVPKAS